MADAEIEPLLPRLRAAISNAYYDARNDGRTMEQAADVAATGCEAVVKAWLADYAAKDAPRAEKDVRPTEGDIAIVTRRSGKQYVGVYTLAPGIDYFWRALVPGTDVNQLRDPDASFEVVGRVFPPEKGGADA